MLLRVSQHFIETPTELIPAGRALSSDWAVNSYRLQTKFAKVMFLHLSVSHSVHIEGVCGRGVRMWQGVRIWQGACVSEGMHGRGCAWQGACMAGGMLGRGAIMACTPPFGRYYEIRSMTGQYASYWNAFLFYKGCPWEFFYACFG